MRIFLVRHGQSTGNVDITVYKTMADHVIPLSDHGHEQAEEAGKFLASFFAKERDSSSGQWDRQPRLWVSPYERTRQTADHIEAAMSRTHTLRDRREHVLLVEQQFGLFDGIQDEDLPELFPNEVAHYRKCRDFGGKFWAPMPLGESRFDVARRVHQSFGTFHRDRDKHGIEDIIVVAHGTTIRAFVMMWLHLPFEWFEKEINPRNCSIRLIEDGVDKGYVHPGG